MNINAIKDRVVIEIEFAEDVSSTGIYLGEGPAKNEGTVVAVGPDADSVKIGDRVIIEPSVGFRVKIAGRKFLIQHEGEIFAVLGDE